MGCGCPHIDSHRLNHTSIDLVELLYLLSHLATLLIYLVDSANLLTGTLQLHFINLIDTGKSTVQILHLLAVTSKSVALLIHLLQGLYQLLQLFHIVALSLGHLGSSILLTSYPDTIGYRLLRAIITATGHCLNRLLERSLTSGSAILIVDAEEEA